MKYERWVKQQMYGLGKPHAKEGSNLQAESEGWDGHYVNLGGV